MKLSRTVAYAVQATLQLAAQTRFGRCRAGGWPRKARCRSGSCSKILRSLVKRGILGSTRGVEGGYSLRRHPAEISLLDMIEAVDGPLEFPLPVGNGLPEMSKARLECALSEVAASTRRELQAVTLAQLLPKIDGRLTT